MLVGIRTSVITVANKIPNASDIAIGTRNCADTDLSISKGNKPKKVVRDVSITGRKRTTPARSTAGKRSSPAGLPSELLMRSGLEQDLLLLSITRFLAFNLAPGKVQVERVVQALAIAARNNVVAFDSIIETSLRDSQ